jgi:DNA-binding Lrp family transcriptional regulator
MPVTVVIEHYRRQHCCLVWTYGIEEPVMVSQESRAVPQPSSRGIDETDRQILRELAADGRMSMRTLAERVHISRASAYARVQRLVDEGVVRGFTIEVDHERLGVGTSAYITLKIEQTAWRSFAEEVKAIPEVEHVALVGGDFDVLLLVRAVDNGALRHVVLERLQMIPGVSSTRTLLIFDETARTVWPGV